MHFNDFRDKCLSRLHASMPSYGTKMRKLMADSPESASLWYKQYHIDTLEVSDLTKAIDNFVTSPEKPLAHDEWLQKVVGSAKEIVADRKRVHNYRIAPRDEQGRAIQTVRCKTCQDMGGVACWSLAAMRAMRDTGSIVGVPGPTMTMSCSDCANGKDVHGKLTIKEFDRKVYVPHGHGIEVEWLKTRILNMAKLGLRVGDWAYAEIKDVEITTTGTKTSCFEDCATPIDDSMSANPEIEPVDNTEQLPADPCRDANDLFDSSGDYEPF